jgi:simple sugar transport system ATP-binding protein
VTTLYQHTILAPSLSIAENVALGGSGLGLSLVDAEARVAPYLHALGVERSPRTLMVDLSHAERQRVEIARALARASRVLLLDEPTALLAPSEVEHVLETLRLLRSRGVAIALVTHKLEEALAVADRLTILRAGRIAGVLGPEELGSGDPSVLRQEIVTLMFGDAPGPTSPSTPSFAGEVVLSLARVSAHDDRGLVRLHDVSLDLRGGETVGIAGVEGNGQTELVEVVAGQRPVASGRCPPARPRRGKPGRLGSGESRDRLPHG